MSLHFVESDDVRHRSWGCLTMEVKFEECISWLDSSTRFKHVMSYETNAGAFGGRIVDL